MPLGQGFSMWRNGKMGDSGRLLGFPVIPLEGSTGPYTASQIIILEMGLGFNFLT